MSAQKLHLACLTTALALLAAAPAGAVNRVANGDFEGGAEPGGSWTGDPTALPAHLSETFTIEQAGSSNVLHAKWSATANGGQFTRKVTQAPFTLAAAANARLEAKYKRQTTNSPNLATVAVRLMRGTNEIVALDLKTGNLDTWLEKASADTALAAGTYSVEILLTADIDNGRALDLFLDNVVLQVSPPAPVASHDAGTSPRVDLTLTATAGGNPGVDYYQVLRDAAVVKDPLAQLTWSDEPRDGTGAPLGNTTFSYTVRDVDTAGVASPESPATTVATVPALPTDLLYNALTLTRTSVDLSWTPPAGGADKWEVERAPQENSAPGAFVSRSNSIGSTTYAYTDSTLACATTYYFRVRGLNGARLGPYTAPLEVTTPACPFIAFDDASNGEPADSTVCPGTAATPANAVALDKFDVTTNEPAASVTSLTLTLEPANAFRYVEKVELMDLADLSTLKTVAGPFTSNTIAIGQSFSLGSTRSLAVRIVPGPRPAGAGAKQAIPITGKVTDFAHSNLGANGLKHLRDSASATVTVNNGVPGSPQWSTGFPAAGNQNVDLAWQNPVDAAETLVVRATSPVSFGLADGESYASTALPAGLNRVYAGTGTSHSDSASNGTTYYYWVASRDGCANWSTPQPSGAVIPRGLTTVEDDAGDEEDAALCPGATAILDAFTVATDSGIDALRSVTVALTNGTFNPVAKLELLDQAGTALVTQVPAAGSTSVKFDLPTALPLSATTPLKLRVRVTAGDYSLPPGSATLVGRVSAVECGNTPDLPENASPTLTVVRPEPAAPDTLVVDPQDTRVQLTWTTTPADAVVVLLRGQGVDPPELVDGQDYLAGATVGSAKVIYRGSDGTYLDTGLTNGTDYRYAAFTLSTTCRAWSAAKRSGAVVPAKSVTRVEDAAQEPASASICPGGAAIAVDAFQVRSTRDPDSVTAFTVRLGDAEGRAAVASVEIARPDGTVLGTAPAAGETVAVTLSPALAVTTEAQPLVVRIVPRTFAQMPSPRLARQVWAEVTGVTVQTAGAAASDPNHATVTIEGAPPAAPSLTAADPGDGRISLAWSAGGPVVLLRATQPLSGALTDGLTYAGGAATNGGIVAYTGPDAALEDTGLENGTAYHYALFEGSGCGVYSEPALVGPVTPELPAVLVTEGAEPADAPLCPGGALTPVDAFALAGSVTARDVSSLTVSLGAGNAAFVARVEIVNATGQVLGAVDNPVADTLAVALSPPLPLSATPLPLTLRLAPKTVLGLPAATGPVLLTARLTAASRTLSGSDSKGATLALDALAPTAPVLAQATKVGTGLHLAWTNPEDPDLAQVILVRGADEADRPEFGRTYARGDPLGAGTVEYAGAGTEADVSDALSAERFRLFARDACGSWSEAGRYAPVGLGEFDLGGCGCTSAAGPAGTLAALALLGLLARRRPRR